MEQSVDPPTEDDSSSGLELEINIINNKTLLFVKNMGNFPGVCTELIKLFSVYELIANQRQID